MVLISFEELGKMWLLILICSGLIVGLCMRKGSIILVGCVLMLPVGLPVWNCLGLLEYKVPLGLMWFLRFLQCYSRRFKSSGLGYCVGWVVSTDLMKDITIIFKVTWVCGPWYSWRWIFTFQMLGNNHQHSITSQKTGIFRYHCYEGTCCPHLSGKLRHLYRARLLGIIPHILVHCNKMQLLC